MLAAFVVATFLFLDCFQLPTMYVRTAADEANYMFILSLSTVVFQLQLHVCVLEWGLKYRAIRKICCC
jgi:hypothetical protein